MIKPEVISNNILPIAVTAMVLFSRIFARSLLRVSKNDIELLSKISYVTFCQGWLFIPLSCLISLLISKFSFNTATRQLILIILIVIWTFGIMTLVIAGPNRFWRLPGFVRIVAKVMILLSAVGKIFIEQTLQLK